MKLNKTFLRIIIVGLLVSSWQGNTANADGGVNTHNYGANGGVKLLYVNQRTSYRFPYVRKFAGRTPYAATKEIISYYNFGRYNEAIQEFKVQMPAENLSLLAVIGLSYSQLDDYPAAKKYFDKMRVLESDSKFNSFSRVMKSKGVDLDYYVTLANVKVEDQARGKVAEKRRTKERAERYQRFLIAQERERKEEKLRAAEAQVAELERRELNQKIRQQEGWGECVQEGRRAVVTGRVQKRKSVTLSGTYCGVLGALGANAKECDALKAAQAFEKDYVDVYQRVYVKKIDTQRNVTLSDGKNERVMDAATVKQYVICE